MMPASRRKFSVNCFQDIIELRSACRKAGVIKRIHIFVRNIRKRYESEKLLRVVDDGQRADIGLFHNMPGNLNRNIRRKLIHDIQVEIADLSANI